MIGVLNTRPRGQAAGLSAGLRKAGYEPHEVPLVELVLKPGELEDAALTENQDGLLVSSPNLIPLLAAASPEARKALAARPWYLISGKARAQAEAFGAQVVFVPKTPSLEGFLDEFPGRRGLRLLHLCSAKTRLFPEDFSPLGIKVANRVVYSPQCPAGAGSALAAAWPKITVALFASGSAVSNLFSAAPDLGKTLGAVTGPSVVSMGASVSDALRARGVENFLSAPTADDAGLISALNAVFLSP
jgi:uroporphyrinogen-III synthase